MRAVASLVAAAAIAVSSTADAAVTRKRAEPVRASCLSVPAASHYVAPAAYEGKTACDAATVIRAAEVALSDPGELERIAAFILASPVDYIPQEVAAGQAVRRNGVHWWDKVSFPIGSRMWAIARMAEAKSSRGESVDDLRELYERLIKKWYEEEIRHEEDVGNR